MGILYSQSVRNSILLFTGIGVGFISSAIIQPKIFSPEENGIIKLLVAVGAILGQLCSLGYPSALIKFKPILQKKGVDLSWLTLKYSTVGIILTIVVCSAYVIFQYFSTPTDSSAFSNYSLLIPIVAVSTLLFLNLDALHRAFFNSTAGVLQKEVIQRSFTLVLLGFVVFLKLDFDFFIIIYSLLFAFPPLMLLILKIQKPHSKNYSARSFPKALKKPFISVAGFGIIAGLSSSFIISLDALFIEGLIGTSHTGVYAVFGYFATLVLIPFRAIDRIASPIISQALNSKNFEEIKKVYQQSTLYLIILSGGLASVLISSYEQISIFLTETYAYGIQVMFILIISNLLDAITGINTSIIANSKFYRYNTYFLLGLIVISCITNYILIPYFGINGAAAATFLSILLYNICKLLFIGLKFGFYPFTWKAPLSLSFPLGGLFAAYLLSLILPSGEHNLFELIWVVTLKGGIALTISLSAFLIPGFLPKLPSKKQPPHL